MATTFYDPVAGGNSQLNVAGMVEPSALAGAIAADAHERVAEAVTLTIDWLEEEGRELNQLQKAKLLECVLRCSECFERQTLDTLMREFSRIADTSGG
jgi:hypothetical protein